AISNLRQHFQTLREPFNSQIDVKEIGLYFRDAAIILNKTQDSLLNNLEDILEALGDHFEFYSNIIAEVPGEIHIPAVEGPAHGHSLQMSETTSSKYSSPYLKHWVLYFDSLERALIYDLNRMTFIPAELCLNSE
ncbi:MAG: hypothetical protein AAFX53_05255, partial [Bacteroidota bacterium]